MFTLLGAGHSQRHVLLWLECSWEERAADEFHVKLGNGPVKVAFLDLPSSSPCSKVCTILTSQLTFNLDVVAYVTGLTLSLTIAVAIKQRQTSKHSSASHP